MTDTNQQPSSPPPPPTPQQQPPVAEHAEPLVYTSLTYAPLDAQAHLARVRSRDAGALVLFAGTTRDTFGDRLVADLTYQAYVPRALATLTAVARGLLAREFGDQTGSKRKIKAVAITHRLGVVPIGEESILVAVAAAHRGEAWRAAEACLEEVKARAEIWKLETFADEQGEAVWRANNSNDNDNNNHDHPGGSGSGGQSAAVDGENPGRQREEERGPAERTDEEEQVPETMDPVVRPRRPGEKGYGAVVHPSG